MTYRKAEIRPYEAADEALLFGLAKLDRGADRRTLAVLEQETVFVAELDGAPAGYVAVEWVGEAMRVDQLFVSPEHEAEGVGRQLLEYAEGYAISKGARALQVVVSRRDSRALDFYRGRGFAEVDDELLEIVLPQR
ncbi:MAG: GNAT family N-acetyltransferase [Gaiellaceae bacterium]